MHFWSRSRDELWHKGETSGNVQRVRELRYDCDADAVLALVDPAGPACHTGERTCFHRALPTAAIPSRVTHEALPELERTLAARRAERPEGSYTAELLADPELIGAKVREEADEVARAVAGESDERVAEEAADVLYHLEVALLSRDVAARRARSTCCSRGGARPVPTTAAPGALTPDLEAARVLATRGNVVPVVFSYVEDSETPVSAFLKLRGDGPCVPARVRRAGREHGPLLVPRLQPATG